MADGGAVPGIMIREAEEEQALDIVALGEKIFRNSWNEQMVNTSIYGSYDKVLVAMLEDELVGYLIYTAPCEDCELLRIAVENSHRKCGIGKRLIQEMIKQCAEKAGENIFLEVRESNEAAIGLYEKMGFQEISRRKDYYREPKEDAVIMKLENIVGINF